MSPRFFPPLAAGLLLLAAVPASADGAALFKTKCASCHGTDGAGTTAMGKKLALRALASAEVQKQSDAVLTGIVSKGKGKMPPFGSKLSADEVKALVAHIRSFKK